MSGFWRSAIMGSGIAVVVALALALSVLNIAPNTSTVLYAVVTAAVALIAARRGGIGDVRRALATMFMIGVALAALLSSLRLDGSADALVPGALLAGLSLVAIELLTSSQRVHLRTIVIQRVCASIAGFTIAALLLRLFVAQIDPTEFSAPARLFAFYAGNIATFAETALWSDRFDVIAAGIRSIMGVGVGWHVTVVFEVVASGIAAFLGARFLLGTRAAIAVGAAYAASSFIGAESTFAAVPSWTAPATVALVLMAPKNGTLAIVGAAAMLVAAPMCWPIIVVAGLVPALALGGPRIVAFATLGFAGAAAFITARMTVFPQFAEPLGLHPPILIAALVGTVVVLWRVRRALSLVVIFDLAGMAVIAAVRALGMRAPMGTDLLVAQGLYCGMVLLAAYYTQEMQRRSAVAIVMFTAAGLLLMTIPVVHPDTSSFSFFLRADPAYETLARCPSGSVADLPVPLYGSADSAIDVVKAVAAGHQPAFIDDAYRQTPIPSGALTEALRSSGVRYVVLHYGQFRTLGGYDAIAAMPGALANVGKPFPLISSAIADTSLFGRGPC